jgi:hypothetical protein
MENYFRGTYLYGLYCKKGSRIVTVVNDKASLLIVIGAQIFNHKSPEGDTQE